VERQGTDENRFERESDEFYRRIYDKYKEIAAREPHRVVILDRNDSIEEIEKEIHAIVAKRISTAEIPVPASILEA
jgi:dTMP kinase